ncbi:MAG: PAS domain S-box protein [Spirochaetaceae bacterium]|nr:MAG: PAS domain S-box protein [Spirochaetaceae bacterium]
METMVSESTWPSRGETVLHRAFCHESPYAVVIADARGRTIEWNRAAERLTGIPREEALSLEVWQLLGRIAPARIPYEVAVEAGRSTFREVMDMALLSRHEGIYREAPVQRRDGLILSTSGKLLHLTVDFFSFWADEEPAFAVCATRVVPA